jgi:hypothetical protein
MPVTMEAAPNIPPTVEYSGSTQLKHPAKKQRKHENGGL